MAADISADEELVQILLKLGPIADQLGTRAVIAQYEADIDDPLHTRAGTSLEGRTGPLPRFLPVRDILRINYNMHAMVPAADVPARLARSMRIPIDDNLATTIPYAPTLLEALQLVARYGDAVVPWYHRALARQGDELRIIYGPRVPLGRIEPLSTEIALATIYRIVETFSGDRIASARVNFASGPVSAPAILADRFMCPISIGGTESFMAIPASWGDFPSPYHDPALWLEGTTRCNADIRALEDRPIVAKVRRLVADALDRGHVLKLEDSAKALGLSRRTLVRMLGQEGTSHQQIVEDERRQRALHLLCIQSLALLEIAEMLGFPDRSSFGRKCRAWFGETPANQRRRLVSRE